MKIRIQEAARQDLLDGFHFYEKQAEGLGDYFLVSIYSDIESLKLYAGIHPREYDLFKLLSKRFPFAIYYEIDGTAVIVRGVLNCRRDPDRRQERLKP